MRLLFSITFDIFMVLLFLVSITPERGFYFYGFWFLLFLNQVSRYLEAKHKKNVKRELQESRKIVEDSKRTVTAVVQQNYELIQCILNQAMTQAGLESVNYVVKERGDTLYINFMHEDDDLWMPLDTVMDEFEKVAITLHHHFNIQA